MNCSRKTKHQEMMAQPLNFTYPGLWHLLENHLIESLHCPMFMINSVLLRNEHLWLLVPFLTNKCRCENSFKSLAKRLDPFLCYSLQSNCICKVKICVNLMQCGPPGIVWKWKKSLESRFSLILKKHMILLPMIFYSEFKKN